MAAQKKSGLPSANLIALLALGVILGVVVVVAISLFKSPPDPNKEQVEKLNSIYLVNPVSQLAFENGDQIPSEWRLVGEMPLKVIDKHLVPAATQPSKEKAGAIILAESIAPDQARMLDVTFRIKSATETVVPQVFISQGPVDATKASGQQEFVWLVKTGAAQVVVPPDLHLFPPQGEKLDLKKSPVVNVKIRFNKDTVIVESGDKRIYEGPHNLSQNTPRYVGVRFKSSDGSDGVWLVSANVLKP